MIRLHGRSINPTPLPLPKYADVSLRKVCAPSTLPHPTTDRSDAVWGVIWLLIAIVFFALGIIVGLAAFKESAAQQAEDSKHFLPVPGSSGALSNAPIHTIMLSLVVIIGTLLL